MAFDKKISRFVSMLAVLVIGGVAAMDMGCAAADPDDSDINASIADESVGEAEQAVGEGGICSAGGCDPGLNCCPAGFFSVCRNLATDENNCGSCGNECDTGQQCINGACECTSSNCCPSGQVYCSAAPSGCTNLNEKLHCGACGNRCNNLEVCVEGECVSEL
ncbi:hypothetical protein [Polyangium sp. 15x6]|uniref:hypothetical protein n=1 Tax=Polyangium sp. 15x6 TaxID=3042687 RepID=UPI00249A5DB0|nr:hypothetical protein [Polyangium sp. 15x6]MDI3283393.1 hypothetical protein [Polyangium sp. 15x6]